MLADPHGLAVVTAALAELAAGAELVAGIDARGFLRRRCGRQQAGHRGARRAQGGQAAAAGATARPTTWSTASATLEVPADGIDLAGRNIVIIDDVLATGGTLAATTRLLTAAGANVTGAAVVLELAALGGRDLLEPLPVSSLRIV